MLHRFQYVNTFQHTLRSRVEILWNFGKADMNCAKNLMTKLQNMGFLIFTHFSEEWAFLDLKKEFTI
jgi:hypothetical protein